MEESLINSLLKCGFEEITEKDIPIHFDEDVGLSSFVDNNIYEFGYLTPDAYCIVHLDKHKNDALLTYEDGASCFLIKYRDRIFIGNWDEGESYIDDEDDWGRHSEVFFKFKDDMLKHKVSLYFYSSFYAR